MADRILFITWKAPVRGLEERAVESFNDAIGLYGRMQQEGRIESFDVVLLAPNGDMNGYIEIHGSAEQLAAVSADEEFQRNTIDAALIVEDLKHGDTRRAIADGLAKTARVITAAAAIMVVVFLAFLAAPDVFLKLFGIGLASAVFLDATIVRMVLVPAVMQLLGERNWWIPDWLEKILPRLDVERLAIGGAEGRP